MIKGAEHAIACCGAYALVSELRALFVPGLGVTNAGKRYCLKHYIMAP